MVSDFMLGLLPRAEELLKELGLEDFEFFVMRHAAVLDITVGAGHEYRQTVYGAHAPGVRLSPVGTEQAREFKYYWANNLDCPDVVVCSELHRARDTAEISIMDNFLVLPPTLILSSALVDNLLGTKWLDIPRRDWTKRRLKYWQEQLNSEGLHSQPENPYQTQNRVVREVLRYLVEYRNSKIVFVSHGDPICFLFQYLLEEEIMNLVEYHSIRAVDKCTLWKVCRQNGTTMVELLFKPSIESFAYPPVK